MKTIGLIGGTSWESTVTYYQILNTVVKQRLGGLHSARCILHSVDFQPLERAMAKGDWDTVTATLIDAAQSLRRAGADCLALCTNTMHKVAEAIQKAVPLPFLHIADLTARELLQNNIRAAALLGTRYTMEQDFYSSRLAAHGIDVRVPDQADRDRLDDIIFKELCLGRALPDSKRFTLDLIQGLAAKGAQAAILGCTEIGLLVRLAETPTPLYDTAEIHARRAALYALGE